MAQKGMLGSSWRVPRLVSQEMREGHAGPTESPGLGCHEPAGPQDGGHFKARESAGRLPSRRVLTRRRERERASSRFPLTRVRILSRGPPTFVISSDLNRRPQTQLQAPHTGRGGGGGWASTRGFQGDTDSRSTAVRLRSHGPVVLGGPLLTQGLRSGRRMGDMRRQTTQPLRAGSVRCSPHASWHLGNLVIISWLLQTSIEASSNLGSQPVRLSPCKWQGGASPGAGQKSRFRN